MFVTVYRFWLRVKSRLMWCPSSVGFTRIDRRRIIHEHWIRHADHVHCVFRDDVRVGFGLSRFDMRDLMLLEPVISGITFDFCQFLSPVNHNRLRYESVFELASVDFNRMTK